MGQLLIAAFLNLVVNADGIEAFADEFLAGKRALVFTSRGLEIGGVREPAPPFLN